MKINNIKTNQNFYGFKITSKEGRKVARIIRQYDKTPDPALRDELITIFKPYFEQEVNKLPENANKTDFIHEMYLRLLENFNKVNKKYHPSNELVQKLNNEIQSSTEEALPLGYKAIQHLSKAEKRQLTIEQEGLPIAQRVIEFLKNDKKYFTKRDQYILSSYFSGVPKDDIGFNTHLGKSRIDSIIRDRLFKLRQLINQEHIEI